MDWQSLFLSPNGRIDRPTFWIGFGLIFAGSVAVNFIPLVGNLLGFLLIWPQVCVHAKRLHDMGRSAWLLLIPFVISVVAFAVAIANGANNLLNGTYAIPPGNVAVMMTALAIPFLAGVGFVLCVGFTPGQSGDNRYGPGPID